MKNTLKVVFVIIGTIIGAGFASGKEIYIFFCIYGINGVIGIVISSIIIGTIIYKVLKIANKKNVENYDKLINTINKNNKINEIIKIIINIFLLISFYIMIAGFSAYFSQELQIPNIIGTVIIAVLCYIIFMGNIESVIKVNTLLIPILIICIILLTLKNTNVYQNLNSKLINGNIYISIYNAILYASYNSILLIPILVSLKKYIKNQNQVIFISIICSVILVILALAIYGLILKIDININKIELPTVYVAGMSGKLYKYIYGGIILVSIYTSAISAGYGILENYTKEPKKYKTLAILMCSSSVLISKIGFSQLINSLYPVFGILGLVQIILLLKYKQK